MTKMALKDNFTDRTSAVRAKNEIDLSWLIRQSAIYDENKKGQRRYQTCKYDLRL